MVDKIMNMGVNTIIRKSLKFIEEEEASFDPKKLKD
jgi:hypothetical protein